MADDLLWKWRWWWDPVPIEIFRELENETQKQIISIGVEAQANMLRTQVDALTKISGLIGQAGGAGYKSKR
jgi:hypothetical protein